MTAPQSISSGSQELRESVARIICCGRNGCRFEGDSEDGDKCYCDTSDFHNSGIEHKADAILRLLAPAQAVPDPDREAINQKLRASLVRKAAIEECAQLIESNQETFSETPQGSSRHLTTRKHGNSAGLAYADGIRALALSSTQERAP